MAIPLGDILPFGMQFPNELLELILSGATDFGSVDRSHFVVGPSRCARADFYWFGERLPLNISRRSCSNFQ